MTQSLVYIVIVTYNSEEDIGDCLTSVIKTEYSNLKIVVVDNNSTDKSLEIVKGFGDKITTISNNENLGCAGGNNIGINLAINNDADYVVILNPDTIVDKRWITSGVGILNSYPEHYGMLYFNVIGEGVHVPLEKFHAVKNNISSVEVEEYRGFVPDCAIMYRTSLFKNIGLYDHFYFAYAEDDDLQIRARIAGYKMVKINRIQPLSVGKLLGILYALIGFIAGIFISIISAVSATFSQGTGFMGALFGIGAVIILPIFYGVMGFVSGVIIAGLYNLVAGWVGGIEVQTQK